MNLQSFAITTNHNTVTLYFFIFIFTKKETKYNYYLVS
ncbi:hypothetical protein B4077_0477 [Bacillus cereus]|uniref:Uncharacterized protein n=1 Tax=Bacillus cereus TaxID=1396 RepID=A0A0G8EFD8_BACCE|nr:hypothetical protein B4077_0477 [Bacillus cereus]